MAEIPGIERIRYTSHPNEFTPRLIEVYGKVPQLVATCTCRCNRLRPHPDEARRGYAMEYKSIVRKLRAVRPGISMSSDFIVGTETEGDFDKLMKLIDDVGYDAGASFIFSPRPAPAAPTWPTTPHAMKLKRLQADRRAERARHQRQPGGARCEILVERAQQEEPAGTDGSHRMQPHRQLRRQAEQPSAW